MARFDRSIMGSNTTAKGSARKSGSAIDAGKSKTLPRSMKPTLDAGTGQSLQNGVKLRVLLIAHSHPAFSHDSAEIAAFGLFKALKNIPALDVRWISAVIGKDRPMHAGTPFQPIGECTDELLFWGADFDHLLLSQNTRRFLYTDFRLFLEQWKPDIVHFHHTSGIGIEALQVVHQTLPATKILYTLHDYTLMCHNEGRMVTLTDNQRCNEATPSRCNQCFAAIGCSTFKVREAFIKAHLAHVAMFVSPHGMLANRFIDWGIPSEKMTVMENCHPAGSAAPFRSLPAGTNRSAFGYFGPMGPHSGVLLLMQAVESVLNKGLVDLQLHLFGSLDQESDDYRKALEQLIKRHPVSIQVHGNYNIDQVSALIRMVDWVVVPGTGWDTAPAALQATLVHKRPLICSDLSGIAETIEDSVSGLQFQAGNAASLADQLQQAASTEGLWSQFVDNIPAVPVTEVCGAKHLTLYQALTKQP